MARKRNPNSKHQQLMTVLFGEADAAKQPTAWRKWPEPYRSIYSRMLASRLQLVDSGSLQQLRAEAEELSRVRYWTQLMRRA